MFKKISKGLIAIDDSNSNGIVDSGNAFNVAQVNREDGEEYDICAVWKDAHFHEPERPKQNAEFICFCFNLQQKYDIGLFEKLVVFLEDALSPHTELEPQQMESYGKQLLSDVKQNK